MNYKKLLHICLVFSVMVSMSLKAQENHFRSSTNNKDSLYSYLNYITEKKIIQYNGIHKKEAKKFWEETHENLLKNIEDSLFIFDERIDKMIQNILSEIYLPNKQIDPTDFYFFINKSPVPNAACYGNGVFTIHNGLFELIENDDELAFILCHEIAHYLLNHSELALKEYLDEVNSKETKKRVREISKQKYGKYSKAREFFKDLNYNLHHNSRNAEVQADSLGLVLFKNTKYSEVSAIEILQKLDFEDKSVFSFPIDIKKYFNLVNYPFKESWLEKEENSLFNLGESANDYALEKDSLKTHPDIPIRIEIMKKSLGNKTKAHTKTNSEKLKKFMVLNSIEASINNNSLDMTLYLLISNFENEKIDNFTFHYYMGLFIKKLYILKNNHSIGKYITPISPFSEEESLNTIKLFINNLELKNIRKIGYWYCIENKANFTIDDSYNELFTFFQELNPKLKP